MVLYAAREGNKSVFIYRDPKGTSHISQSV